MDILAVGNSVVSVGGGFLAIGTTDALAITGTATVGESVTITTPEPSLPHFMEAQIAGKSEWIALTAENPLGGFTIPPQAAGCYLRVCYVELDGSGQPGDINYSDSFGPVGLSLDTPDITVSSVSALNTAIANTGYSVIQVDGGTYDGSAVVFQDRSANPLIVQSDPTDPAVFTNTTDFSAARSITWKGHQHTGGAEGDGGSGMFDAGNSFESLRITGPDLTPAQVKSATLISALSSGPWWSCEDMGNCTFSGLMIYNMRGFQLNHWSTVSDVSWKYLYFDGFRAVSVLNGTTSQDFIAQRVLITGLTGIYEEESESAPHCDFVQSFNDGGGTAPSHKAKGPILRNFAAIAGNTRAFSDVGDAPILQVSQPRGDDAIIDCCFWSALQSGINSAYASDGMYVRRSAFRGPNSGGGSVKFGASPEANKILVGYTGDRSSYSAIAVYKASTAYSTEDDCDNDVHTNFSTNYRGPDTMWDVDDWPKYFVANAPKAGTDAEGRDSLTDLGHMIMLDDLQDAPSYSTPTTTTSSFSIPVTAVTGAEYYRARYRQGSSGTWATVKSASEDINVTGLSSGTSYQFQVCVSTAAAGISRWSAIDSVTTS